MYELLKQNIIDYDVSFADETTVQVLKEKDRKASSKSYMWVFGGGNPDKFCYIYNYSKSRSHEVPLEVLDGFTGYLHCDDYSGYDALSNKTEVSLVACWYHARRKFIDVQKVTKKSGGLSGQFLDIIKKLAKIESIAKDEKLTSDGRLEISNNLMERKVKPFVIGRKNWLFYDSVSGADAGSIIYSLIETCKEHNIEPYYWLKYTLSKTHELDTEEKLTEYLPYNIDKGLLDPKILDPVVD